MDGGRRAGGGGGFRKHNSRHHMEGPKAEMLPIFGSGAESCLVAAFTFWKSTTIRQASMDDWSVRGRGVVRNG